MVKACRRLLGLACLAIWVVNLGSGSGDEERRMDLGCILGGNGLVWKLRERKGKVKDKSWLPWAAGRVLNA